MDKRLLQIQVNFLLMTQVMFLLIVMVYFLSDDRLEFQFISNLMILLIKVTKMKFIGYSSLASHSI